MSIPTIAPEAAEQSREPVSRSGPKSRLWWMLALVAVAVAATAVVLLTVWDSETAPTLSNGDFETGDLAGWTTESRGSGDWLVYEDGANPPDPSISDPSPAFEVPDPPQGQFAAVADMDGSGVHFLYRDIEVTGPWTLHATVFYENHGVAIYDPPSFGVFDGDSWYGGTEQNQQFRIDLIDPESSIQSLEDADVLATVFRTQAGDPPALEPSAVRIDLSPWEGQVVRLRVTEVDNLGPLRTGIDDVRLD